jgi:cytochrome c oxidase subunit II
MRLQSALDAAGFHASGIERLWWIFFWTSVVVYVAVVVALLAALLRRRRTPVGSPISERATIQVITVAVGITVLTLFVLLTSSIFVGRGLAGVREGTVTIKVTGHQWWWQVEYEHPDASRRVSTANEIYLPVGETARVELRTADVIHSFWVPNLHGKQDLINGVPGVIFLRPDRPGTWRGQCAEFCGLQHAKMSLWVTALPKSEFAAWWERQQQPSKIPSTAEERKGQEAFMNSACPMCHSIAGTDASGKLAPDLTHFASRRSIAAGTAPNRRGELTRWILDPQHLKPGNYMPPTALTASELHSIVTYLESLE